MKYYSNTVRGGAFNREAYHINEERRSIGYQRAQLSKPFTHIWDVPYKVEDVDEDNDTDDEGDDSSDEEEEELAGDLCAGASDPALVIIYTMAGGGAHWWNYEVHYDDDGQQAGVYINNINGCRSQWNQVLFYYEDLPDQLRLEDTDFEADGWSRLEHHA